MSEEENLAWAAGIIEGEGTIRHCRVSGRKNTWAVGITVKMADEDIITRLKKILKVGTVCGPYLRHSKNRPMWTWSVQNQKDTYTVMLKISHWLGVRRSEKARDLMEFLEERLVHAD